MKLKYSYSIVFISIFIFGCNPEANKQKSFELLRKDKTGLNFDNVLLPSLEFNGLTYMYFFNGGGVAAGDFNADGLCDLYFTSNMGSNKMYLNEGGMHFKDINELAGVSCLDVPLEGGAPSPKWSSGASVVDINNDGLLDIYVSQVGDFLTVKGRNHLYICQGIENGIPVYADQAIQYGLDLVGFGTQAAFLDYDMDGDLDMFQLNHSVHANGTFGQKWTFEGTQHPLAGDKLMRNDGGKFTEVTLKAGIKSSVIGYGLGIAVGDVNLDGWPDIYIGNDFHENDYLYINQKDGTFRECLTDCIRHTSQFSMGVDIADLNNDGWNEIFSLDMLPEDPYILKSSLGEDDYGLYQFKLGYGYNNQYARNTLQKNNGDPSGPNDVPTFSEIGMFAGIYATDWSWSSLFMDMDNDGLKDLFISNGIERRMNDIDYANYRTNDKDFRFKQGANLLELNDLKVLDKMPQIKIPNKFFHNSGTFRFHDMEAEIGDNLPSFSNGAIYADLDNDGDLDVVVNNLNDEPFIYQNLENEKPKNSNAYLSLELTGSPANRSAIGAKVVVLKKTERLFYEFNPVHGFQSSGLTRFHIGLGDPSGIDSMLLIWPDNSYQEIPKTEFNKILALSWTPNLPKFDFKNFRTRPQSPFKFEEISKQKGLQFTHVENPFVEFDREELIPHMVSAEGPALAVGDINGDGLEDVYFGSSKRNKSAIFYQTKEGNFTENTPEIIKNDSLFEDVDARLVDLDNDGDLDLVVAAGGNEYRDHDEAMKQRAYFNDGKGGFTRRNFEGVYMTAACVLPGDFNQDGLVDLFFGARALPWNYGLTPASALLLNKGNGQFEDVTDNIAPGLKEAGLIKDGSWADMDGDGDLDLLLAIEWEAPTIFINEKGHFKKHAINEMTGWWNFVIPYDFDSDGDIDILAGNLGSSNKLHPSPDQPVRMYVADFDDNQQVEQVLSYFVKGREVPFANHQEMMKRLPSLKKKYLLAKDFAKASLPELLGQDKLNKAVLREANTFESIYFENTGQGFTYTAHPLPDELQYSTLNSAVIQDLDQDGKAEVILAGNFYRNNIEMGRYDANYGNVLRIKENGQIESYPLGSLRLSGEVRNMARIKIGNKTAVIFARNDDSALLIEQLQ
ncbi:MAG: CRTAC1 family protein [Saprospiraceae bacterium]